MYATAFHNLTKLLRSDGNARGPKTREERSVFKSLRVGAVAAARGRAARQNQLPKRGKYNFIDANMLTGRGLTLSLGLTPSHLPMYLSMPPEMTQLGKTFYDEK